MVTTAMQSESQQTEIEVGNRMLAWGTVSSLLLISFGGGFLNDREPLGLLVPCKAYHRPHMQVQSERPAAVASVSTVSAFAL